jgi:hypothetical protein
MPVTSINQVYSELDAESRKNAYFELITHRISKKRFARPQVGTRGGPRKGPTFLKAKVVGFQKELGVAQRFGISKAILIQFLKDNH